jgi:type II secretory pathway pseudopilin PulG
MVGNGAVRRPRGERGYNLVVLIMIITVMNILVAVALPLWSQVIRRDKEEELVFRGLQYAEAIRVFHMRFGRWPNRLEELVEVKPRSIRQLWKDPMTEDGKWQLIFEGREQVPIPGQPGPGGNPPPGQPPSGLNAPATGIDQQGAAFGPIKGVYSRSKKKSILLWNGGDEYDLWRFNVDVFQGGARTNFQGAGVPTGLPASKSQLLSRWIGRPFPGQSGIKNGGFPGGGTATPGAPGVPRLPDKPNPPTAPKPE